MNSEDGVKIFAVLRNEKDGTEVSQEIVDSDLIGAIEQCYAKREAKAAQREYTEALIRGEEPHYPQWADEVLKGNRKEGGE